MAKADRTAGTPRRTTLEQERSQRTRAALIDAAEDLMTDDGLDSVKVSDLCRAAGVSKGLYYFYFATKEDLLVELLLSDLDEVARAVDTGIDDGVPLDEVLTTATSAMARRAQRRPRAVLARSVAEWFASLERHAALTDGHRRLRTAFAAAFEHGRARGEVSDEHHPAELGALLEGALVQALLEWATATGRRSGLKRRLSERTNLILRGATL